MNFAQTKKIPVISVVLGALLFLTGCTSPATEVSAPSESTENSSDREASSQLRTMVCVSTGSDTPQSFMWDSASNDTNDKPLASKTIMITKESMPLCAFSPSYSSKVAWGLDGVSYWIYKRNSWEIRFTGQFGDEKDNLIGDNTLRNGTNRQLAKASIQVEAAPSTYNGFNVLLVSVHYY